MRLDRLESPPSRTSSHQAVEDGSGPPADACTCWTAPACASTTHRVNIATNPLCSEAIGNLIALSSRIGPWSAGRKGDQWRFPPISQSQDGPPPGALGSGGSRLVGGLISRRNRDCASLHLPILVRLQIRMDAGIDQQVVVGRHRAPRLRILRCRDPVSGLLRVVPRPQARVRYDRAHPPPRRGRDALERHALTRRSCLRTRMDRFRTHSRSSPQQTPSASGPPVGRSRSLPSRTAPI